MCFEIKYEFAVALIGRDEALNEEYYKTEEFVYDVDDKLVKNTIVSLVIDNYKGFKDHRATIYEFIDDHDMWYDLQDEYEKDLEEILYDECYKEAFKQWCNEKGE